MPAGVGVGTRAGYRGRLMRLPRHALFAAVSVLGFVALPALTAQDAPRQASGGELLPEQACFDVLSYRLELTVDPLRKRIDGALTMRAKATAASERIALHLDGALQVASVAVGSQVVPAEHTAGLIRIPAKLAADQEFEVRVAYGGEPRVAPRAPWDGGFTWSRTKSGKPWIATTCQGEGADLWWPCKDHPSDKPATVDLLITVPRELVCAANGKLLATADVGTAQRQFHWHIGVPIANYCVALNIGPYEIIEEKYQSLAGDAVPVQFFVLPENRERATKALPEFLDHLRHMEEVCGPYPFRGEKYGIVETPHLGMEHQTIIAYGNEYRKPSFDYDWLHHHEMCHEWWANLVTCRDWKDMWIHEGIGTYMQALYIESRRGKPQYFVEMGIKRRTLVNARPIAPRQIQDSKQIYFGVGGGNDLYYKGSCVMHTLRFVCGDEKFFVALRRLAYPDPKLEKVTDGSCVRFEDTDGVQKILEQHTGLELGWFFDVYLRQAALPELLETRAGDTLKLRWKAPHGLPFPMPIEVAIDGVRQRVAVPAEGAELAVPAGKSVEIDPDGWVLREKR
jgi:aminopeptidase N